MELNILDWFQTLHTPILDKIMTSITKLGDAGIFWIILTLLFLIIPKMRKTGIIMAAALIMDLLICNVAVKKNKTIRCKHQCAVTGGKASRLFIPIGTYSRIFCFGYCVISRRRKEALETGTGTCLSDCSIEIISVCPLSDGCSGWYGFWNPGRICGLPDCEISGSKAFRKKERRESDTEVTTCTG